MSRTAQRLRDLEKAAGAGELQLHLPRDDHDHAAEWARLRATRRKVGVVIFPGLNAEAAEAFKAAEPREGDHASSN